MTAFYLALKLQHCGLESWLIIVPCLAPFHADARWHVRCYILPRPMDSRVPCSRDKNVFPGEGHDGFRIFFGEGFRNGSPASAVRAMFRGTESR